MKKYLTTILFWVLSLCSAAAQWTSYELPEGGPIQDLCADGNQVYALSTRSLYESTDEGVHWVEMPGTDSVGNWFSKIEAGSGILYGIHRKEENLWRSTDPPTEAGIGCRYWGQHSPLRT